MGGLIDGDDGLPAEDVGEWVKEKHRLLCYYLATAKEARKKWIGPGKAGATYIDVFSGPGRARVRETGEWVDGGAIAAWKTSLDGGAPFSVMYIADLDVERRAACAERLRRLGATVVEIEGDAITAASSLVTKLNKYAMHFAFLDPFSLEALDFRIIESLASFKYMDMLIHVSAMDLNRNMATNTASDDSAFDRFAPGWRGRVTLPAPFRETKRQVVDYWRTKVANLGKWPSPGMHLITGGKNQPLYWLLLAAGHNLAHKFWKSAMQAEKDQGDLFP